MYFIIIIYSERSELLFYFYSERSELPTVGRG